MEVKYTRTSWDRDHAAISDYLEELERWGIQIDHEDGSTAPFTSVALQSVFPSWRL